VAAASRLGRQLEEVIASLGRVDVRFALIGGLALASHKVIRATQDLEDIKALIAANRQAVNMDEVREYFRLFNREAMLERHQSLRVGGFNPSKPRDLVGSISGVVDRFISISIKKACCSKARTVAVNRHCWVPFYGRSLARDHVIKPRLTLIILCPCSRLAKSLQASVCLLQVCRD